MILECPSCETRFLVDSSLIPPEGREVRCAKCAHQWHVDAEMVDLPSMDEEAPQDEDTPLGDELPEEDIAAESEAESSKEEDKTEPAISIDMSGGSDLLEAVDADDEGNADDFPESPSVPSLPKPPKPSYGGLYAAMVALILLTIITGLFAFRMSLQPSLGGIYAMLGMTETKGLMLSDISFRQKELSNKVKFIVEGSIVNDSEETRELPILRVAIVATDGEWLASREYEAKKELKPGESYPFKASKLDTSFIDRVDHLIVELGNGVELMLRE